MISFFFVFLSFAFDLNAEESKRLLVAGECDFVNIFYHDTVHCSLSIAASAVRSISFSNCHKPFRAVREIVLLVCVCVCVCALVFFLLFFFSLHYLLMENDSSIPDTIIIIKHPVS